METQTTKAHVLPSQARMWIYQADRKLNDTELKVVEDDLKVFLSEWNSHGKAIIAEGWIEDGIFLILAVDEEKQHVGGCSIDQSTRAIREMGEKIKVDFFNRMNFVYLDENGELQHTTKGELPELYAQNVVDEETPFYDTLINKIGDWEAEKLKPLAESWHKRFL